MIGRFAFVSIALALMVAGCSTVPGTAGGASSGGPPSPAGGGGGSSAPAASVPDPCTLISGAEATSILASAGTAFTYTDGTVFADNADAPFCRFVEANRGIGFAIAVCTTATCDFGIVRDTMGGDPVTGVGDDAFFQSTCQGSGLLGHDQMWATAKGLVFHLTVDCRTEDALPLDKGDEAMIELMKLAISRS